MSLLCRTPPWTGLNGGHASSSAAAPPKLLQFDEHRSGANCDGGVAIPEAFRCLGLDYSIVRSGCGRAWSDPDFIAIAVGIIAGGAQTRVPGQAP
jgi:hypothetical protein